jgi:predicted amidohydrolase YtcJ
MTGKILTNGIFYSLISGSQIADTVEIDRGIISKIGRAEDILANNPKNKRIIDLHQSIVIPGFTDSHIHLLAYGLSLQQLDLSQTTKGECIDRVAEKVSRMPPGTWIIGHGWDHNHWHGGFGNRQDLDAVSEQHPIYLTHKSLHCAWANSLALEMASISKGRIDPPGGSILIGEDENPIGILLENAMELVRKAIPEPDQRKVRSALELAQQSLNEFGITAVHDFDPWSVYTALKKNQQEQVSSLRVTKSIPENHLDQALADGLKSGAGDNWVRIGWLKLFSDGALGSQTAAMLSPYEGSDHDGMLLLDHNELVEYGRKALPAGITMAVHAIGDRANQTALSAFDTLKRDQLLTIPALPPRIEHAQIIAAEDIARFSSIGVIASMQPIHAVSDMIMAQKYWGNRCQNAYAWRSLLDQEADLIFGSDAPVESPNPFYGITASLSRRQIQSTKRNLDDTGWTPHQCLAINDTLNAYCQTPARIGGFKSLIGAINTGMFADLVVLPSNFFRMSPYELMFTKPIATMVNGNWVFKNDKIDIELTN